jgi:trk/ktr system potassium uptake protein
LLRDLTPPQLFVASFALLILVGATALEVLPGLYTGAGLSWIDALFTATSAVCVTGLVVVDTATYFTRTGQAVILCLIQLGGLGIITFTTVIILALGRRVPLRQEMLSASSAEVAPHIDYHSLARHVLRFTFLLEGLGAAILLPDLMGRFSLGEALWHSVFQAVSAFCNAGFSTFSDSLMGFQRDPVVLGTVAALITMGGLGFLTLEEMYQSWRAQQSGRFLRISLHSRLVLTVTALLIVVGAALFLLFEWNGTLRDLPVWAKLANGVFASITPRTAGFNSVDYRQTADNTNFLTILLMFIGGSPGSTAGGIKTTTFGLVGLLAWARFRGRDTTSLWGRTVPEETIQRAVGLTVIAFGLITAAIFGFATFEIGSLGHGAGHPFLAYMFEAVSAFNTVGLSMGATPSLSTAGRLIAILLMYLGRVGPLTFAAAVALPEPTPAGGFRYAYEDVVIG